MKRLAVLLILLSMIGAVYADIAPNLIVGKGIYPVGNCMIQMKSETVYAYIYQDSSRVECTFEMVNVGDSITKQIGFPDMNFHYNSLLIFGPSDETNFNVYVDNKLLTEDQIQVPAELESIYNDPKYAPDLEGRVRFELAYEQSRKIERGNFPWYVWYVHFEKNEKKTIKVEYTLPCGIERKGPNKICYFKYLLETGAGWYGSIEQARIELKLYDINMKTVGRIQPEGYKIYPKRKVIEWNLKNLEPTKDHNIYLRYYNPSERKDWENYQRKLQRKAK